MPRTVLIVDDHAGFRESARELLEDEGFTVVGAAADGAGALDAAKRLHPEIVLLDVRLPDLDGFQVAERLAETGSPPDVVLISSREESVYGPRIATVPARGFIPKRSLSGEAVASLLD